MDQNAIEKYQKILKVSPEDELARFSLGNVYWDAEQYQEAKVHFQVAFQQKPDWMAVAILLGKCHLALGEKKEAKKSFEAALRLAISQHHEGPREELEGLLKALDDSHVR